MALGDLRFGFGGDLRLGFGGDVFDGLLGLRQGHLGALIGEEPAFDNALGHRLQHAGDHRQNDRGQQNRRRTDRHGAAEFESISKYSKKIHGQPPWCAL